MYWVFLWAFGSALPLSDVDFDEDDERILRSFNSFCTAMLAHEIGGEVGDQQRSKYLMTGFVDRPFFHPSFAELQVLFRPMLLYLSIP